MTSLFLAASYLISRRNTAEIIPGRQEVLEEAFPGINRFDSVQEASLEVFSIR